MKVFDGGIVKGKGEEMEKILKNSTIAYFVIFMIMSVILSSCYSYQPTRVSIDRFDKDIARQKFLDALTAQLITQTNWFPFTSKITLPYQFPRMIQNGEYRFVGVKSTGDEKFFVFLFEPTVPKYETLAAYVFKIGNNPVVNFFQIDNPTPGKFQNYFEVSDLAFCYGQTKKEPTVDQTGGRIQFSTSYNFRGEVNNSWCEGNGEGRKPMFIFFDRTSMEEFARIFLSAFPIIRINN